MASSESRQRSNKPGKLGKYSIITNQTKSNNNAFAIKKNRKFRNDDVTASDVPMQQLSITPSVHTAFKTLVSARLCSAIWTYISDCDETYNYWEPLHYIIYGHGLQTWEYSAQFALRSYTYLLMLGVPSCLYKKLFYPSPVLIFYMLRCVLGCCCAIMERFMYRSICQEFGIHIARLWLIFQVFSAGMFISSTAFLPSSFAMYFCCGALAAWWQQRYRLSIFLTAIASLLGWPFAALIGIPIALDMLIRKHMFREFLTWTLISGLTIGIPMLMIDSSYFGKWTFAPLNIVWYNVFTSHGPNIFGTEPLSYYLINGFLNYNIIWILSLITPIMLIIDYIIVPAKNTSTLNFPHYVTLAPFYLWLLVFGLQSHKEERFLFPVYPLISLCGAISVNVSQRVFYRLKTALMHSTAIGNKRRDHYLQSTSFIAVFIMLCSTLIGLSRLSALHRNYHAPMDLMTELNIFKNSQLYRTDRTYDVCIGKDWYRFPGSFFFPESNFRLRFLKSDYKGMLPAYYADGENSTQMAHAYFNDMNLENEYLYFDYKNCEFLIDFDEGKYTERQPPYSMRFRDWKVIKSLPFLIQEKSHRFYRAFYIPFISDNHITYGNFNLLQRKTTKKKF